jgi:membrane protein
MAGKKITLKGIWELLKESLKAFGEHNITKLSGSLAYYTVFSLAPLMVLIISLAGIFLGQEAVEGKVYETLDGFLGTESAAQLQETIQKASLAGKGKFAAIIGGVTLLIGATTVFAQIQDSINDIWGVKAKPKRGWLKLLKNRVLSFSIIVTLGFLLLVSLVLSALIDTLGNHLQARFPDVTVMLLYVTNLIITFLVSTALFAVIFKVLPDAKMNWRDMWPGAITTAILFMIGKFGISVYIAKTDIGSTYGAAGSLVILLLWVYYSAIILYFGAAITKSYANNHGSGIRPKAYATITKVVELEREKTPDKQPS